MPVLSDKHLCQWNTKAPFDLARSLQVDAVPRANNSESVADAFYMSLAREPARWHWPQPSLNGHFYVPPAQKTVNQHWYQLCSIDAFYVSPTLELVRWHWHRLC